MRVMVRDRNHAMEIWAEKEKIDCARVKSRCQEMV